MYDRVAHLYDDTRGWPKEVERLIGAGLYYLLVHNLNKIEPKVLEIGVGTGRVAVPLAAHGARLYGIDVAGQMMAQMLKKSAAISRAGFPQKLAASQADAGHLPFADNNFDVGLAVHILHLVPDWQQALAELQRVVRPGGLLAFGLDLSEPDEASWVEDRWNQMVEEAGEKQPTRKERIATTYEALQSLKEAGYNVEDHLLARWIASRTPRRILDSNSARSYPGTWSTSDKVLQQTANRLEQELLAQFGSLDAHIERESCFKVMLAHPSS